LQVPSSHFIGLSIGQIIEVGQLNGLDEQEPYEQRYGVLDGQTV